VSIETPYPSNDCTLVVPPCELVDPERLTARESFLDAWSTIRRSLTRMKRRGFLLVASHPRWGSHSRTLPLLPDRSSHRIVGRHDHCDLRLAGEPDVSLRHLLVSAWLDSEQRPILRALDLGGQLKPRLEDGSACSGFRADGSCSLALGSWWLHLILADGRNWPQHAQQAWQELGESIITGVLPASPRPEFPHRVRPRLRLLGPETSHSTSTVVVRLEAPEMLADLQPDCTDAIGYLTLGRDGYVNLSPAVLERGVLVGRYERCAVGGWQLQLNSTVSRVHLCLVSDPTGLWAIDTNSSNGSWAEGQRFRAVRLGLGLTMHIGREELCWHLYR